MDVVIPYVDGSDLLWQRDFRAVVPDPVVERRYRDWGTLPFLLRGIERHLPFVDRVYLVVSRESQVPAWADRSRLQVVLHADIIPAAYLPTFNSTTIELFLHRIPGLSERFLYFNDDIFPVQDTMEADFYPGGKPATGFARHLLACNLFKKQTRRSDALAREALGLPRSRVFLRPQHTCSPMLRSACEELFEKVGQKLLTSITPVRDKRNVNQYVFLDYLYLSGRALARRRSCRHISLATATPRTLEAAIGRPDHQFLCINDVDMEPRRYEALREVLQQAFLARFPQKSSYEL